MKRRREEQPLVTLKKKRKSENQQKQGCVSRRTPLQYPWMLLRKRDSERKLFLWNTVRSRLVELTRLELEVKQCIPGKGTNDLDLNCMITLFHHNSSYRKAASFSMKYLLEKEKHSNLESYGEERDASPGGVANSPDDPCLYSYSFDDIDCNISTYLLHPKLNLSSIVYLVDTRLIDGAVGQTNLVQTRQYGGDRGKENGSVKMCEEKNCLYCFPNDLIRLILTRFLDPVDYLNFRCVSRSCRLLAPQIEWRKATIDLAYAPPLSPWFMMPDHQNNVYNFLDSKLGGKYSMNTPELLVGTKIVHSKNGWLLMYKESMKISYFYNPFTTEIIKLPKTRLSFELFSTGFSSPPTSSKCTVAALEGNLAYVFQVGWKKWQTYRLKFLNGYYATNDSPVFHNGSFYFLGENGSLGVLKVEDDEHRSWKVVKIPTYTTNCCWYYSAEDGFFLECDGKLMYVRAFALALRGIISIVSLNETTMSWERDVVSLENHTLYLCKSSSFSIPARANWMKNTILFSRFLKCLGENSVVYYSIDTKKYEVLGDKSYYVDYVGTLEYPLATWIKPSWS